MWLLALALRISDLAVRFLRGGPGEKQPALSFTDIGLLLIKEPGQGEMHERA